jgi:CBS domain containing-hemolysin-like protein
VLEEGYSRYPVYDENIDHIVGVVSARDIWRAERGGLATLRDVVREVPFVPDTRPLEGLLREMQDQGDHLVVVIDEFGGTAGIVTMEGIIEGPGGELHLRGGYAIAELNEAFGLALPEDDYTTIGGFVLGRLGRVARVGDQVEVRGARLRVLAVEGRRIDRVALDFVRRPPTADGAEPGDAEA